jgi:hypothetical protein
MLKKWLIVVILPIFCTVSVMGEEKLEDIITQSFTKRDSRIYLSKVVPSFEEFLDVRQKMRGHASIDMNQSKDRFIRKKANILADWEEIQAKFLKHRIDTRKLKLIDVERSIDKRVSQTLGRDAVRYTYLNYAQGDKIFSIKIKECVKFTQGWRCGGGLKFKKVEIEDGASSAPTKAANTK